MIKQGDFHICLPRFDYMSQKNTYSGNVGAFRYKFFPEKKDEIDTVLVAACYKDRCYEAELEAGRVAQKEFDYSNEGIDAAEQWIYECYLKSTK